MLDIMRVFACLSQRLSTTAWRQLTRVTEALLAMSGRVTMRGLSRWVGQGGSYRGCNRAIPRIWATQKLAFCKGKPIIYEVFSAMALDWE